MPVFAFGAKFSMLRSMCKRVCLKFISVSVSGLDQTNYAIKSSLECKCTRPPGRFRWRGDSSVSSKWQIPGKPIPRKLNQRGKDFSKKHAIACHKSRSGGVYVPEKGNTNHLAGQFLGEAIMTWLYSLVFAGLLFSSQNGPVKVSADSNSNTQIFSVADETERFEQTYPLTPNGRVSVSNVNGSITVNAWDRNEVKLVAVKTADSKERLADVEIKVDAKPDYLCVETNYDNWKNHGNGERWRNGKLQVDYELSVPRGAV